MPTFDELSQHTSYPVLHAKRNDGVIIVATRVPLADVRLQQWGWILSQAYTTELPSQNGFEGLIDSAGKQYSKIYTLVDMQRYNEKWGCQEWEVGYFAIGRATNNRVTIRLEDKIVQEDTFKDSIEDLKKFHEGKIYSLVNVIKQREIYSKQDFDNSSNNITALLDKMHREMLTVYADQREHLDEIVRGTSDLLSKTQEDNAALISFQKQIEQLNETLKSIEHDVTTKFQTTILAEVADQVAQLQAIILEKIEHQPHLSEQNLSEHLNELDQKQLDRLETLTEKIKYMQASIDEVKDVLVPINVNDGNTNADDAVDKLSTNVKTLSDRYITSLISTNTRYYNTVDKQVKDSFKLTRYIIYGGGALFALTIISLLVTFFFHSNEITLITNGVGAALSAITIGIGGLNKVHDNAADRQLKILGALNRSVKATHAQFVIEKVNDETWKRAQLEQLSKYIMNEAD